MKKFLGHALLIGAVFFFGTMAAQGLELGRVFLPKHKVHAIVETAPMGKQKAISDKSKLLGRVCALSVRLQPVKDKATKSGTIKVVGVDARMPHHNHGMVVKPSLSKLEPLHWRVEGFKLHMKGLWQIKVIVQEEAQSKEEAFFELNV